MPRQLLGTALAGLILGFGGITAGSGLVHASERGGLFNFIEELFRGPPPEAHAVARPRAPARYSSLPDAHRVSAVRIPHYTPRPSSFAERRPGRIRAAAPSRPGPVLDGTRTVCVRTCDGYVFPLGRLRSRNDLPVHEAACAAACPNAPTLLFTLAGGRSEMEQAVSLKGQPYLAASWANVYRQKRVENCACRPPGVASVPLPIAEDPTVRRGDVVATEDGAEVVTRLSHRGPVLADFRDARGLSRRTRRQIDDQVGTLRRDAAAESFRRTLRTLEREGARIRVAEAGPARLHVDDAGGFRPLAVEGPGRLAPVRVVVASPFTP